MNLFVRLKLDELNLDGLSKVIDDLVFHKHQTKRSDVACFCEHRGISIRFTPARSSWHALVPCALKPWWLFLNPLRRNKSGKNKK